MMLEQNGINAKTATEKHQLRNVKLLMQLSRVSTITKTKEKFSILIRMLNN